MKKALLIFAAILLGGLFPFGHAYTYLIRPNLMIMLFFAFFQITINAKLLTKQHLILLGINVLLPTLLYLLICPFHEALAQTAFVLTIVPTAAAAPVISEILKTNTGEVTVGTLLSTPIIALLLPLFLTKLLGLGASIPLDELVFPVITLVFIPLIISQLARKFSGAYYEKIAKLKVVSFPLFLINVFIACGNAAHFIKNSVAFSPKDLALMLGIAMTLCIFQFQVGAFVGRRKAPLTYSLIMGRKNTMIGLWLCLTYFSPFVALAPICYILCHNVYNSVQIWQRERV